MSGMVVDELPGEVRAELARRAEHVERGLIDATRLASVRDRFDDDQAEALARYLGTSQSANTVRAYRSDWRGWLAWCAAQGRTALPADPLDLAVYLATSADLRKPDGVSWLLSPATLERKAAAIAAVHAAGGLPSPTRADVVRLTLRGIRRARGARPNRKRPVLLHTLADMLAHRPDDGWPGGIARRRDTLLLLVGFAGALRRSELAGISIDDVRVDTDPRSGEPVLIVELATTKTDQTGVTGQQVVLPRGQRPDTCPVCAFADWTALLAADDHRDWLAVQTERAVHRCHDYPGTPLADGTRRPLFPSINRHGGISATAITGRAVGDLVKRYAERAGLDPAAFGGHSLRAGFATQAALGGASDREIMRQGRWSNAGTVHRYIRTANPLDDNAVTKLGL
jgi:integrase